MKMINNQITINNKQYNFKECFDTNLCLSYENDTWSEWHIIREFVSNALDAVYGDVNMVEIINKDGFVYIHDEGSGFPIKYAKRIGASSKKDDSSTIGQLGEGCKLAILTCIRKGINIILLSQNWLIIPKIIELEEQQILFFNIYETSESISGSLVIIKATEQITDIIDNIEDYFLQYNKDKCLFGDISNGIFPCANGKAKLYNKGVFIRENNGLFSYAISIDKLNRDRDLISYSDIAYEVRNLWADFNNKELIKVFLNAGQLPNNEKNKLIEFYYSPRTTYPELWAEAFTELFGETACLFSNDIAAREANALGFDVIRLDDNINSILTNGGIKYDSYGLGADYEFEFAQIDSNEKEIMKNLSRLAKIAGFELPETIKVFDKYKNNESILGIYNTDNHQIYIKKDILSGNIEEALKVLLHEANHHETNADDTSREFADSLCSKLAKVTLILSNKVGHMEELEIDSKGLKLPRDIMLSAAEMEAIVAFVGNEVIIKVGKYTISFGIDDNNIKPSISWRRIILKKSSYIVTLPKDIMSILYNYNIIKCYIH